MTQQVVYRSDEALSHFRCPVCQGWWTVGDFDRVEGLVTCPHCRASLVLPSADVAPLLAAESLEGVHYAPSVI